MRSAPPSRNPAVVAAGALAVAAIVLGALIVFAPGWLGLPAGPGENLLGGQLIGYSSSVDGVALSYYEWFPTNYSPAQTYPLAIFLHGQGLGGDELIAHQGGSRIIDAAAAAGFLLISINTPRSDTGFYVNSPFSGPEEQDVLDAIAHEQSLRHVGSLYLFGSSMGTVGSYSIATHHPGEFAGIGVLNSCPDVFEALQWRIVTGNSASISGFEVTTGGKLPGQTNQATSETYYLSSGRFFPQNLSGTRIYVTQGGNDQDCPNNPDFWAYQNANDSVLTSTCVTVPSLAEPNNCTLPFATLETQHPGMFPWRFLYEPQGTHTLAETNGPDLFSFWLGQQSQGVYWADFPYGTNVRLPPS